jgi:hypothetical protein
LWWILSYEAAVLIIFGIAASATKDTGTWVGVTGIFATATVLHVIPFFQKAGLMQVCVVTRLTLLVGVQQAKIVPRSIAQPKPMKAPG